MKDDRSPTCVMKKASLFVAMTLAALAGLAGCRSLGYSDQAANNALTPGISEKEYVRTWTPTAGHPGEAHETVVQQVPAATLSDPAHPNYTGPGNTTAAPSAPAPAK
jgi:hypothetical protein